MQKKRILYSVIILIGFTLVAGDWLFVTLGIDTLPPNFTSTTPHDKSQGFINVLWLNTPTAVASIQDVGSGVQSVTYIDDAMTNMGVNQPLPLMKMSGTSQDGVWEADLFPIYVGDVNYYFEFTATDNIGNVKVHSGTFFVYENLDGRWYINNVKITSPTQTIWIKDNSVEFKFLKTKGVSDDQITCSITGDASATLALETAGTWTNQMSLVDGVYNLNLVANDGTNTVSMSIYGLQIGSGENIIQGISEYTILGIGLIAIGAYMMFKKK